MPAGSSSAAPVVSPGPSVFQYSSAALNGFLLMRMLFSLSANSKPSSSSFAGASNIFSMPLSSVGCSCSVMYLRSIPYLPISKKPLPGYTVPMISRYTHQELVWIDLENPTREEVDALVEEFDL